MATNRKRTAKKMANMSSCITCRKAFPTSQIQQHVLTHARPNNKKRRRERRRGYGNPLNTVNSGRSPNMAMKGMLMNSMRGLTPGGRKFATRVLHPNDDTEGSGCLIPDNVDTGRVDMELRDYQVFSRPADLTTGETWDIMFVSLPFSDVPMCWCYRQSGTDGWSRFQSISPDRALEPGQITLGDRTEGTSVLPVFGRLPAIRRDNAGYRQVYKGVTMELNRSSFYDQGIVTAGMMIEKPPGLTNTIPYTTLRPSDDEQDTKPIPCYIFENVPKEEGDIIRWCPQATQWEAKKGLYMPMRWRDTVNLFELDNGTYQDEDQTGSPDTIDVGTAIKITSQATEDEGTSHLDDFVFDNYIPPPGVPTIATTAGLANQALGVILFRGIHSTAQVVMKMRVGVEVIPKYENPLHTKIVKPERPDPVAIQAVSAIAEKMPIAFEHRFNSSGDLLGVIRGIASKVLPTLAPWLNKLLGGNYIGTGQTDEYDG